MPTHRLVPGDRVAAAERLRVAHVQVAGGVREHVQRIEPRPLVGRVVGGPVEPFGLPALDPARLDLGGVVAAAHDRASYRTTTRILGGRSSGYTAPPCAHADDIAAGAIVAVTAIAAGCTAGLGRRQRATGSPHAASSVAPTRCRIEARPPDLHRPGESVASITTSAPTQAPTASRRSPTDLLGVRARQWKAAVHPAVRRAKIDFDGGPHDEPAAIRTSNGGKMDGFVRDARPADEVLGRPDAPPLRPDTSGRRASPTS